MEQITRLTKTQLQEAAKLADDVFRAPGQKSMSGAFPYIFAADMPESIGIYEDGKLAAFMGIVPGSIRVGQAILHVYSLGSVCTHSAARGKGYASKLLDYAIGHASQAGASLLLVSGDRSLYLRSGCRPFGNIKRYTLDERFAAAVAAAADAAGTSTTVKTTAGTATAAAATEADEATITEAAAAEVIATEAVTSAQPAAFTVRDLQPGDSFAVAALADRETAGYGLSLYDRQLLLAAESYASCVNLRLHTLVAERADGKIATFAVIGVPDGTNESSVPKVLESAGDPQAVVALFAQAMHKWELNELICAVSPFQTGLMLELDKLGVSCAEGRNGGTVKILSPERLWEQLGPFLSAQNEAANRISVSWNSGSGERENGKSGSGSEGGSVALHLDGKTAAQLESDAFLSMIFNDGGLAEANLPEPFASVLTGLLPIPFPYTEGLYYI